MSVVDVDFLKFVKKIKTVSSLEDSHYVPPCIKACSNVNLTQSDSIIAQLQLRPLNFVL
jgi:hypothetical protein